jgi:hypothetical protein
MSLGRPAVNPVDIKIGDIRRFVGRLTTSDANAAVRIEGVTGDLQMGGVQ